MISSVTDDKGRKTVVDLLPNVKERIYPVGRLDWDTSGVLILTNDGDFTDEMIHPRNDIDKVYVARVKGVANKDNLPPFDPWSWDWWQKTKPAVYEILKVDSVKTAQWYSWLSMKGVIIRLGDVWSRRSSSG